MPERAAERDMAIVTAERCTGGLLASLLSDIEGASRAFERGFVVYPAKAKCKLLGIEAAMIDRCGAVSEDGAVAMAKGALARSREDVAVAITAFAGPRAPEDEEGMVHLAAINRAGKVAHWVIHRATSTRGPVREKNLGGALELLGEVVG